MRLVSLVICLVILLSYVAMAQESDTVEAWVEEKLNIKIPKIGITWESVNPKLEYNWYVRWRDAKIQLRDKDENLYRLYLQGDTLYLDYKREFVIR